MYEKRQEEDDEIDEIDEISFAVYVDFFPISISNIDLLSLAQHKCCSFIKVPVHCGSKLI